MIRRTALAAALCLAAPAAAQDAPREVPGGLFTALRSVLVPPDDDPDARLQRAWRALESWGDHPAAAAIVTPLNGSLGDLRHPEQALESVRRLLAGDLHGAVARELQGVHANLLELLARFGERRREDPFGDHAATVLTLGPFGDPGNHYVGVAFPPELGPWDRDRELAGRFGPVAPRVVRREPGTGHLDLAAGEREDRSGCRYALWRLEAAEPFRGYLEIDHRGSFQVFVDGREIARVDRAASARPDRLAFPFAGAAGEVQVLVKTAMNGRETLALRAVDLDGHGHPGLREIPAEQPPGPWRTATGGPEPPAPWRAPWQHLHEAARTPGEHAVAALVANAVDAPDAAMAAVHEAGAAEGSAPADRLALAVAWRRTRSLPQDVRLSRSRALTEGLGDALPDHATALLERATLLAEADRREEALRMLREAAGRGLDGPELGERRYRLVRRLRFSAEVLPALRSWRENAPGAVRPRILAAGRHRQAGDMAGAKALLDEVLERLPGHRTTLRLRLDLALDTREVGRVPGLTATLAEVMGEAEWNGVRGLRRRIDVARRLEEKERATSLLADLVGHPAASADDLEWAGNELLQLEAEEAAVKAWRQALARAPDRHDLRQSLRRLAGDEPGDPALERFRRDGDAVISAFEPDEERESSAASTLLFDQQIVELGPDGSRTVEVHQIRRINDPRGVERFEEAEPAARASELMVLRTVTASGETALPNRVAGTYSMPRLEPGAFVEWRFRNEHGAPGADPWRTAPFRFRDGQEPLVHSELVVVLPEEPRGTFRARNDAPEPERLRLDDGRDARRFVARDVPRLPRVRHLPPVDDLVPTVVFGEDGDPSPRARGARAHLLRGTRPSWLVARKAGELGLGELPPLEAARRVHAFCQEHVRPGDAEDATSALLLGRGNAFQLEVALLRAAEIPLSLALARSSRAELSGEGTPLFREGTDYRVLGARLEVGDRPPWLFADAPRHAPLGTVPAERQGARALLLGEGTCETVRVPIGPRADARQVEVRAEVALAADASATLDAEVTIPGNRGYELAERVRQLEADLQGITARRLGADIFPEWRLEAARTTDLEPPGRPLRITLRAQRAGLVQESGDELLLPRLMPAMSFVAGIGGRSGRSLPLHLDGTLHALWKVRIDPGPFRFAELPAPLHVRFGPLEYSERALWRDGVLELVRKVDQKPGTVVPGRFAEWMQVLQELDESQARPLHLRR